MEYTIVLNEAIAVSFTLFATLCMLSCMTNYKIVRKNTPLVNYESLVTEMEILKKQNEEIISILKMVGSCDSESENVGCQQSNCCNISKSMATTEEHTGSIQTDDSESRQEADEAGYNDDSPTTHTTQNVIYYETENIVNELTPCVPEPEDRPIKHSGKFDEKHKQLMSKLQEGQTVHVSYYKTTFNAVYEHDETAPNGYVFKAGQDLYYTPSQFSLAKKQSLNSTVTSDNGWDTVYIVTGKTEKNKDIKKYLNDLIAT
jgi:hypothetical protein